MGKSSSHLDSPLEVALSAAESDTLATSYFSNHPVGEIFNAMDDITDQCRLLHRGWCLALGEFRRREVNHVKQARPPCPEVCNEINSSGQALEGASR
jgi:hypothetical protein